MLGVIEEKILGPLFAATFAGQLPSQKVLCPYEYPEARQNVVMITTKIVKKGALTDDQMFGLGTQDSGTYILCSSYLRPR